MNDVPINLIEFINSGNKFIVAGHREPDGDCVGSQLVLCSVLERLGKIAVPCSAGPFKRTEIKSYEKYFMSTIDDKTKQGARVIVVDCTSIDRTGSLEPALKGLPVAQIDHHKHSADESTIQGPVYVNEKAPSTTVLILNLIDALGATLQAEEAELLLFGLCTDTGFFRHVDCENALAFETAARLTRAGANPKKVFQAIHGGKSLNSRLLLARILGRAESHFNGKLILSYEEYEESVQFGMESRDSDTLYQLIQSVSGVEAIAIIRQETPENCTIGLRSLDKVDVGAIARKFGGGGHLNASGVSVSGTITEIRKKLLEIFPLHLS